MLGRRLVVDAVHGGGNRIFQTAFLNAGDARALYGVDRLVSFFLLAVAPGADVGAAAARLVPFGEAHSGADFARSFGDRISEVGYVFQTFNLLEALSALENVAIALNLAGVKGPVPSGRPGAARARIV